MGKIEESIGGVRKYITFIHAFSGCETTFGISDQGKLPMLKLIGKSKAS